MSPPTTQAGWLQLANDWYQRWINFPHVIGAIDGKHVACKAPPNSGSEYYNYKGFFSTILFAMVTSDYKFLWVDVSGNGSSDAHIYKNSELREGLERTTLWDGHSQSLCHTTLKMCHTSWCGMTPSAWGPTWWSTMVPGTLTGTRDCHGPEG